MKVLSIFLFLLCIPIHSMADTYEYFIKLGINDIKYDVHISIRESSIRIYDSFDLSWSYNDTMPQCVNSNNTKILLRDFHVENVKICGISSLYPMAFSVMRIHLKLNM